MEMIDTETARRVWQRVRGGEADPDRNRILMDLLAKEAADAAVYLSLSRQFQGKQKQQLLRMYQDELEHLSCLRGIFLLENGMRPTLRTPEPDNAPAALTLRRCYSRELAAISDYESRVSDPAYGAVYRGMAAREHDHCRCILELLGNLHVSGKT